MIRIRTRITLPGPSTRALENIFFRVAVISFLKSSGILNSIFLQISGIFHLPNIELYNKDYNFLHFLQHTSYCSIKSSDFTTNFRIFQQSWISSGNFLEISGLHCKFTILNFEPYRAPLLTTQPKLLVFIPRWSYASQNHSKLIFQQIFLLLITPKNHLLDLFCGSERSIFKSCQN